MDDSKQPRRAYILREATWGYTEHLVYGHTAADAKDRYRRGERGMDLDDMTEPKHIMFCKRCPEEDL